MGSSGSGKSTLLYALSGMDKPTLGKVYFGDEDISGLTNDQLAVFRRKHCGFVFQSIYLLENMTVFDNVMTGALVSQKNSPELVRKAEELLKKVGMGEDTWKKYPNQLSGGECQRVGIVRAVVNDPQILFADEPTGSLNSASGRDVPDIFTELHGKGQSIVMVTHDIRTALRGNRVVFLSDGAIVGEHEMPPYGTDDAKARREGLQDFLNRMVRAMKKILRLSMVNNRKHRLETVSLVLLVMLCTLLMGSALSGMTSIKSIFPQVVERTQSYENLIMVQEKVYDPEFRRIIENDDRVEEAECVDMLHRLSTNYLDRQGKENLCLRTDDGIRRNFP